MESHVGIEWPCDCTDWMFEECLETLFTVFYQSADVLLLNQILDETNPAHKKIQGFGYTEAKRHEISMRMHKEKMMHVSRHQPHEMLNTREGEPLPSGDDPSSVKAPRSGRPVTEWPPSRGESNASVRSRKKRRRSLVSAWRACHVRSHIGRQRAVGKSRRSANSFPPRSRLR